MYGVFARPGAAMLVGRACSRMLGAYMLVGLGACIFAKEAINLLASPDYARAADVAPAIVAAYLFYYASIFAEGVFYVAHRTAVKPWIAAASMVVMCGLYLGLIPKYGARGAACAAMGGFAFHAAITWMVAQRILHVRYEYGRLAAMGLSAAAIVVLASQVHLGAMTVPAKLVLAAAWPAFLWCVGLVRDDEKAAMRAGVARLVRWLAGRWTTMEGTDAPVAKSIERR